MEVLRSETSRGEVRTLSTEGSPADRTLADLIRSRKNGTSKLGSPALFFDAKNTTKDVGASSKSLAPNVALLRGFEAALKSARTLGLPADMLSSYLLSFARSFSLHIDTALLQRIRSTILRSSRDEKDAAFAAILAASKGTELSAKGIDSFVAELDPDSERDHNSEGQSSHHDNPKKEAPEAGQLESLAQDLQQSFAAFNSQSKVFNYLNRLEDKEGKRWITFPLTQMLADVEIHALVRLLLVPKPSTVERLLVELDTTQRYWSFDIEKLGQKDASIRISADPALASSVGAVSKAFSEIFGKQPLRVHVLPWKAIRFTDELVSDYKSIEEEA
ncbi:hypothetical protein MASR2M78_18690 [Treponema sp.]